MPLGADKLDNRGVIVMLTRFSAKQYLMLGTALTGVGGLVTPTAAMADCLINATNDTVTCTTADTNGFQSSINSLTIEVTPGAIRIRKRLLKEQDRRRHNRKN